MIFKTRSETSFPQSELRISSIDRDRKAYKNKYALQHISVQMRPLVQV